MTTKTYLIISLLVFGLFIYRNATPLLSFQQTDTPQYPIQFISFTPVRVDTNSVDARIMLNFVVHDVSPRFGILQATTGTIFTVRTIDTHEVNGTEAYLTEPIVVIRVYPMRFGENLSMLYLWFELSVSSITDQLGIYPFDSYFLALELHWQLWGIFPLHNSSSEYNIQGWYCKVETNYFLKTATVSLALRYNRTDQLLLWFKEHSGVILSLILGIISIGIPMVYEHRHSEKTDRRLDELFKAVGRANNRQRRCSKSRKKH